MKKILVCLGFCDECEMKNKCPKSIQKKVKNKILERIEIGNKDTYYGETCMGTEEVKEIVETIEKIYNSTTLLENFKDDIYNLIEISKIMKSAFSKKEIDDYIEKSLKNLFFPEKDLMCKKMEMCLYYLSPGLSSTRINEIVKNIKKFMEEKIINSIKKIKAKIEKEV